MSETPPPHPSDSGDLSAPQADHVFDGGSMDCGSGLILLIRQNMQQVPVGGILEIHSSEPTVTTELPPWCRMVGHQHVSSVETEAGHWKHRVRRGDTGAQGSDDLDSDKDSARAYRWSLRGRQTDAKTTTIYARNQSWNAGASLSFDRTSTAPTALEQLLGALVADVLACFADQAQRDGLTLDELEVHLSAQLANPLAAIGMESGDAAIQSVELTAYVTSPATREQLESVWQAATDRAPVLATLRKACSIDLRLALV